MKIGFMGGSFNPPHIGHLNAAKCFYEEAGLDKLIIIPAKVSPFKVERQSDVSDLQRLEMSRLCFGSLREKYGYEVEVSDLEIKNDGVSYTILTVEKLKALYPRDELTMYVGSDMFLSLEKWKSFEDIFRNCSIFTMCRENGEVETMEKTAEKYRSLYGARITLSRQKEVIVSSTEVRDKIRSKSTANCEKLLTEDVLRYIIKGRLYLEE